MTEQPAIEEAAELLLDEARVAVALLIPRLVEKRLQLLPHDPVQIRLVLLVPAASSAGRGSNQVNRRTSPSLNPTSS